MAKAKETDTTGEAAKADTAAEVGAESGSGETRDAPAVETRDLGEWVVDAVNEGHAETRIREVKGQGTHVGRTKSRYGDFKVGDRIRLYAEVIPAEELPRVTVTVPADEVDRLLKSAEVVKGEKG